AFPVLCGSLFAAIVLAAGFIARDCLRLGARKTLLMQIGMGSLSCWLLFQIQGCLAYSASIAPALTGLSLLAICLTRRVGLGAAALAGILLGGVVFIYTEVASFEAIFPLVFVFAETLRRGTTISRKACLSRFAILLCFLILTANTSLANVWPQFAGNARAVTQVVGAEPGKRRNQIGEVDAICGATSYYDCSRFNRKLMRWSDKNQALMGWLCVLALYLPALFGFIRLGRRVRGLQVAFLSLLAILILVSRHDSFRFFRAVEYSMPYVLIGLAMASGSRKRGPAQLLGTMVLCLFISMNLYTDFRTIKYIHRYSLASDPVIRRFNPAQPEWRRLTEELSRYPQAPVLIAGFRDTVHPHWLVVAIEPHPNFLSDSITGFWPLLLDAAQVSARDSVLRYRQPSRPLHELVRLPDWTGDQRDMIARSRQALVPRAGNDPAEWASTDDIYPHERSIYPNICDLINRDAYELIIDPASIGSLSHDREGAYRRLAKEAKFQTNSALASESTKLFELYVEFDGGAGDLQINGLPATRLDLSRTSNSGRCTVKVFPLTGANLSHISLSPARKQPLKLRMIRLHEILLSP
ncbi:MAG TPA: hypothetical protein V6C72_13655, partial [Chroococcales cyanobacterium]